MAKVMSDNIRYVGALQDFGVPYVSLYANYGDRHLYVLINLDPDNFSNPNYLAASVSPREVEEYMDNEKSLSSIISNKLLYMLQSNGDKLIVDDSVTIDYGDAIDDVDEYNADFCDDEFWIHTFLNRIKDNKALEVITQ